MASEMQQVRQSIDQAVEGMSDEQLDFHPEGKWSTANILEHLALAFSGTSKGLERALEAGKPTGTRRSLRDIAIQFTVLTIGYFPPGRQAPKMVVPTGTLVGTEAVRVIRAELESMTAKLDEGEKQLGSSVAILNHPILGPLTAPRWRAFHLRHTRHHMEQVAALRAKQRVAKAAAM